MLSIIAWCNAKISQRQGARLYSRLGGKLLGRIDVNFPNQDACKRLCYLQEQAAKLLGHPTRGYRDVLLWTNELCLTPDGFAYDDAVSPACAEKLDSINASSRLEVSWNEDDSFAKRYVKKLGNFATRIDNKVGHFLPCTTSLLFVVRKFWCHVLDVCTSMGEPSVQH